MATHRLFLVGTFFLSDKKQSVYAFQSRSASYLNRTLNLKNIENRVFAVIDWNYTAYCKVRDQAVDLAVLWEHGEITVYPTDARALIVQRDKIWVRLGSDKRWQRVP